MPQEVVANSTNFKLRAAALAIDVALLAAIHTFLFLLLSVWLVSQILYLEPLALILIYFSSIVLFFISFIFLHMIYFTIFHAWLGQTIGKMIMGIRVVTEENRLISPAASFLRWTGYILSLIPLASGFLWSAVDKDHCAWHDRLAGTKVVSVEMT